MITFDEKGHVFPYEIIDLTLEEVERIFVINMEDKNWRRQLFDNYIRFLNALKKEFPMPFFQWVNGSFTTQKALPGDIDVVSFIDYDEIARKAGIVHHFNEISKETYQVDAHFAPVTKWRHRFYQKASDQENYWNDVFGTSRRDENLIRYPKGIIKIKT